MRPGRGVLWHTSVPGCYHKAMSRVRLALGQVNPTVGGLRGNADMVIHAIGEAQRGGAHIVALPELAMTGYPPEDLLFKPGFIEDNLKQLRRVVRSTAGMKGIVAIVGFVDRRQENLFNSAALISGGRLLHVYHKMLLPNYGVFDEGRYFRAGPRPAVYRMGGICFGVNICEDIWEADGPTRMQAEAGAGLIVNINASPYSIGKARARERLVRGHARRNAVAVAYVNTVGAQDEVVFDGGSFVMDRRGRMLTSSGRFREELLMADIKINEKPPEVRERDVEVIKIPGPHGKKTPRLRAGKPAALKPNEEVYEALKLGLRDYIEKNGFSKGVVVALSGGVDSALVATIAADALGPKKVRCVFMPSRYSSRISREDAEKLAGNLRVRLDTIAIEGLFEEYESSLAHLFRGRQPDATEENLQARIRGTLIMALSNKTGAMVLTTGNKSEMSVGYATLYGDMAGGFAVIKDVPKTMVFGLARWRNRKAGKALIPRRIITREPSAELREAQRDTDSLPPYEVLDPILEAYIEENLSISGMREKGLGDEKLLRRVAGLVDMSEYKRRQSPPGVKITSRAFGRDWRIPITNRYKA